MGYIKGLDGAVLRFISKIEILLYHPLLSWIILGGELGFYGRVSALDNLLFFSDLSRILCQQRSEAEHVLEMVGLSNVSNKKVQFFREECGNDATLLELCLETHYYCA
jgi:ABC-type transport system involved in cytochrome c biogenesis ATPase subunit